MIARHAYLISTGLAFLLAEWLIVIWRQIP